MLRANFISNHAATRWLSRLKVSQKIGIGYAITIMITIIGASCGFIVVDKQPLIECYPGQLNQAILNILNNAIDALDNQQTPKINISTKLIEKDVNQYINIYIIDNGIGMTEKVKAKSFDPFFTTKPVGQGTGLGLSVSYKIIVEQHKGKLYCNSTPEQSTEFIIELPIK